MATLPYYPTPARLKLTTHPNESTRPLPPQPTSLSSKHRRYKTLIRSKKTENKDAFTEKKLGIVDYDKGKHDVWMNISGLRKDDIQKRYRERVEADKFQKDWSISEVVRKILKLNHWDNIEGLLNRWVGRFARKNFPVLVRVIAMTLCLYLVQCVHLT